MNFSEAKILIEPWTDLPVELKVLSALIVLESILAIKKNLPDLTKLPWERKINKGYDEDYDDLNPFLQRLKGNH